MEDDLPGGQEESNEELFERLLQVMDSISVPTTRPSFARADEVTGLTLLSLALRQHHVHRVAEHLTLINTRHLSRSVSVDVDLRTLSSWQRRALQVHSSGLTPGKGDREDGLWVPIARHSREDLSPVVVRDSSGEVIPRLTQRAATEAIVAGVTKLFRIQLRLTDLSSTDDDAAERTMRLRARWLVEAAIARMIEHGTPTRQSAGDRAGPTSDPLERKRAKSYLLGLPTPVAEPFAGLLRAACQEYFLIVMISGEKSHEHLTYQAPLIPASDPRVGSTIAQQVNFIVRRLLRLVLPLSTEFKVKYTTLIPRSVASYHVTIEVPEEIDIRQFILTSDTDQAAVQDLQNQVAALHSVEQELPPKIRAMETEEALASVGAVGHRRQIDARSYRSYLSARNLKVPGLSPTAGVEFLSRHLRGPLEGAQRETDDLENLSEQLQAAQWGQDASTDNDPREHGAHAQWRQVALGFGPHPIEPVTAQVYLAMADEPPALVESVGRMVLALVGVVLGTAVLLEPPCFIDRYVNASGEVQADAIVAVLLIVPGLLVTRLDIPSTRSVLGRLRRFPLHVAYLSVIITGAAAVMVATGSSSTDRTCLPADSNFLTQISLLGRVLYGGAGVLVLLVLVCVAEGVARSFRRHSLVPNSESIPRWLSQEFPPHTSRAWARVERWWRTRPVRRRRTTGKPPRRGGLTDAVFDATRPVTLVPTEGRRRRSDRADDLEPEAIPASEGPARLATLGAAAIADGHNAVELSIIHGRDRLPQDLLSGAHDMIYTWVDGLSTQVNSRPIATSEVETFVPIRHRSKSKHEMCWNGRVPMTQTSIQTNLTSVDLLVVLPALSYQHLVLSVLSDVLGLAGEFPGVVPTLLQLPAAAPPLTTPETGPSEESETLPKVYMRLIFALGVHQHEVRLNFQARVVEILEQHDLGLYRASRLPGSGSGDWRLVNQIVPAATKPDSISCGSAVVPVTLLCDRHADSYPQLIDLATRLIELQLTVTGTTMALVGQHAVVTLLLPKSRVSRCADTTLTVDGLVEVLGGSTRAEGTEPEGIREASTRHPVTVCLGGPAGRGGLRTYQALPRNLWFSWEIPDGYISVDTLAAEMIHACERWIGTARIVHWRSHHSSTGLLIGRARLQVRLEPHNDGRRTGAGPGEGARATAVQSHVADVIVKAAGAGAARHAVRVHVTWSEIWLSRNTATS